MDTIESDLKNYKSLFEEIAQNDHELYLNKSFQDAIRYVNNDTETRCCCCNVHRRQNRNFIAGGAVTNACTNNTKYLNAPIYNTIWVGEMKNATDYIEYLNETRRNSFSSLNKDNRSNYYNLMLADNPSMNYDSCGNGGSGGDMSFSTSTNTDSGKNFLQVPKLEVSQLESMRRTPEFKDISKKIDQIHNLDSSVSSLIYKSIEVHADILSLDATVSRLLAETRKLLEELEDVKCLDDIIDVLNSESTFYPIVHREWMFPIKNSSLIPIDEAIEGVVVG